MWAHIYVRHKLYIPESSVTLLTIRYMQGERVCAPLGLLGLSWNVVAYPVGVFGGGAR